MQRVTLRRRIREAYRLQRRQLLTPELEGQGCGVDIAFVYLDSNPAPYDVIEAKMALLLTRIASAAAEKRLNVNQPKEEE